MHTDSNREIRIVKHACSSLQWKRFTPVSPRRLGVDVVCSLVILANSADPGFTPIPQPPEHCFSVNRTLSYERDCQHFAKGCTNVLSFFVIVATREFFSKVTLCLNMSKNKPLWRQTPEVCFEPAWLSHAELVSFLPLIVDLPASRRVYTDPRAYTHKKIKIHLKNKTTPVVTQFPLL